MGAAGAWAQAPQTIVIDGVNDFHLDHARARVQFKPREDPFDARLECLVGMRVESHDRFNAALDIRGATFRKAGPDRALLRRVRQRGCELAALLPGR